MAVNSQPPRLSIGIDFGTAYTAVVLGELSTNGNKPDNTISRTIQAIQVLPLGDEWKLDMTFGRKWYPNGSWEIFLADEINDIGPQDKLRYLKFAAHGMDSVLSPETTEAERLAVARSTLSASVHEILKTSTLTTVNDELERVAASVSPQEAITKAMARIWVRHIWPAVQGWADNVQVEATSIVLEITIGFPGIWSKEESRQYGQTLLKNMPVQCSGSLSMIEEGHATLIGAFLTIKQVALETGKVYTIFDAGGGTVDATSCLVVCREPLVLRPLFPAEQSHSGWYGFETIMIRYMNVLKEIVPSLMEPYVEETAVQEIILQMLTTLRSHTHNLLADNFSDREREVCFTHPLFSTKMPKERAVYESAGIQLHNLENKQIVLSGALTKAVIDYTIGPAITLLKRHVVKVLNFCREHREYKHSGVLVTSGGFSQNHYFRHLIQRSAYAASGGYLKENMILDCSRDKATLAIGAAHFAEGDRANSGRFVHCRLGIVSAVELQTSHQQDTLWAKTEPHPSNPNLVWMDNLFLWAAEGGLIRACEKLYHNTISLRVACADIHTKQESLSDDPWSPLTNVFISAANNPVNGIAREPEVRVTFSEEELAAMHKHGIFEGTHGVIVFGVRLRWIGGSVKCSVQVPLTSEPIDAESFSEGECICKTVYINVEPEPDLLDLTKLFGKSTIRDKQTPQT